MNCMVVGFAFDIEDPFKVQLMRKNRPDWQRGLLNGVGGHMEPGETPQEAMTREFQEEAGVYLPPEEWTHTVTLRHAPDRHPEPEYELYVLKAKTHLRRCETVTDEELVTRYVGSLSMNEMVGNLIWLIPLQYEDFNWPIEMVDGKAEEEHR